jgi:hypothetical protein
VDYAPKNYENILTCPVPEFIDPVFAKTGPKTGNINSGTGHALDSSERGLYCKREIS